MIKACGKICDPRCDYFSFGECGLYPKERFLPVAAEMFDEPMLWFRSISCRTEYGRL